MFLQFVIVLLLASHIDGSALNVSASSSKLNNNVQDLSSSRIVGGEYAPPGYATHMVALLTGEILTTLSCGGSIITEKHILTAAHCIEPLVICGELLPSFRGVIGNEYWNSSEILVRFTGYVMHKGWDPFTIKNDIGMLFTDDIRLSDRVSVIALNFNWIGSGEKSFVTGWGTVGFMMLVPDKLKILNVSTIDERQCVESMAEWGSWMPPVEPAQEICTFHSPGHGMCHGDSGSALVLREPRTQIGIVSWGFPCAVGAPDIYVRISSFKDFILDIIQEDL